MAGTRSALRLIPPTQARLDVAHAKQAESEGGRQQALKAVQEAWKQIDELRADVRRGAVPCLCRGRACSHACVTAQHCEQQWAVRQRQSAWGQLIGMQRHLAR